MLFKPQPHSIYDTHFDFDDLSFECSLRQTIAPAPQRLAHLFPPEREDFLTAKSAAGDFVQVFFRDGGDITSISSRSKLSCALGPSGKIQPLKDFKFEIAENYPGRFSFSGSMATAEIEIILDSQSGLFEYVFYGKNLAIGVAAGTAVRLLFGGVTFAGKPAADFRPALL